MTEQQENLLLLYWSGEASEEETLVAEELLEAEPEAMSFLAQLGKQSELLREAYCSDLSPTERNCEPGAETNSSMKHFSSLRFRLFSAGAAAAIVAMGIWFLTSPNENPGVLSRGKGFSTTSPIGQRGDFSSESRRLELAANALLNSAYFQSRNTTNR